jgi:hypothetical protein
VPKIETNDPGATGWPVAKLAPFKTPPDETEVCAFAAIAREKVARIAIEMARITSIVEGWPPLIADSVSEFTRVY